MNFIADVTMTAISGLATLFVFGIGAVFLALAVVFVLDVAQTGDAVRRNYPVIGRFRYLFSTLGEFFRQYFFAMDREEMPFNRAEREWAYRAAKGEDNTIRLARPGILRLRARPFSSIVRFRHWQKMPPKLSRCVLVRTAATPMTRLLYSIFQA